MPELRKMCELYLKTQSVLITRVLYSISVIMPLNTAATDASTRHRQDPIHKSKISHYLTVFYITPVIFPIQNHKLYIFEVIYDASCFLGKDKIILTDCDQYRNIYLLQYISPSISPDLMNQKLLSFFIRIFTICATSWA